ncbi:hypothetical protein BH23GEM9_BH23GEM9_17620 [soil metagenome]
MSVYTNPAAGAARQSEEYVAAVLALLGSGDPFEVLETTSGALRAAVAGLSAAQLRIAERPGKWSIRQVLRHLADSEIVWAYRLRMILAQDRPALQGYDQDAWAERLGYADSDPAESLTEFALLRRSNLRILERASEADRKRVGLHVERGEESLDHLLSLYAGHDLLHLRQLERIRNGVAG